ncbi:MAG TPA: aldo/keto reductase, partial [Pseudomonas sp.]|nr:aldo/keto reductase [Pseudomonas sp.]
MYRRRQFLQRSDLNATLAALAPLLPALSFAAQG